jgi:hypothetical protein
MTLKISIAAKTKYDLRHPKMGFSQNGGETPTEQLQFLREHDEYHYNLSVLNAEK